MIKKLVAKVVRHGRYLAFATRHFGLGFALGSYGHILRTGYSKLPIKGGRHVYIRPDTTDIKVFQDIWIEGMYSVVLSPPSFVIDAGGHIGLASAYFATQFPGCEIVVIEPDEANFELLSQNLQAFPNIRALKAGLWSEQTGLKISNPGDSPWALRTEPGAGVRGVTIDEILAMTGRQHIDLLKLDIEGSECEVLNASASWMGKVKSMLVELHDRYRPGCTAALERAIQGHNFARSQSGEYTVLIRN